tara:strand:+ start:666 stop:1196 length:531 start_codon:yes stop_codon:yes gene_type:complete
MRLVVISGCSGGGKTSILDHLDRMGYHTISEPGLRIVRDTRKGNGDALPWVDAEAFAQRALDLARDDLRQVLRNAPALAFLDRGIVDAAAALEHARGTRDEHYYDGQAQYDRQAFFVPPWKQHFLQSEERQHSFADACAEYTRLLDAYDRFGFDVCKLPKCSIADRATHVLTTLDA